MRRVTVRSGLAVGAAFLVAATAVASCGTGAPAGRAAGDSRPAKTTITSSSSTTTTTTAVSVTELPVTPITWTPCNGDLQCGNLVVPLDYTEPNNGQTIPIAVARHLAEVPADRIGSLVIDPGGPGVSGVDDMANELSVLTPGLLDDFDIVMFDPRGVDRSDPVTCGETPGSPPATLPNPVPTTPSAADGVDQQLTAQYAAACEKASGTRVALRGDGRRRP